MTIYLMPCGRSTLDGLRDGKGQPADVTARRVARLPDLVEGNVAVQMKGKQDDQLARTWREVFVDDNGNSVPERLHLPEWHARVCAETSTLAAGVDGVKPDQPTLVPDGDTVVLLASDTPDGLASALLAAARISGGTIGALRYAETPEKGQRGFYPLERNTVTVVRVRGLDPDTDDHFHRAVWGIGDVMRAACEADLPGDIEVHLTGGVKAVLLHTLALAEVLCSRERVQPARPGLGQRTVTARYLFEDAAKNERWGERITTIGLRVFDKKTLEEMQESLNDIRTRGRAQGVPFQGAAWEYDGETAKLTAFGYGYLAVLGELGQSGSDDHSDS